MPTSFDDLLARARMAPPGPATTSIPPDWGQGRSSFGGLIVALALERMRLHVAPDRRPRSLLVAFVGPIEPGGEVEIAVEVLRAGRSATQLEARVRAGGALACTVSAAFADDRPSKLDVPSRAAPERPGPEGLFALPFIAGLTPAFTQHVELRWALGGPPYSRQPLPEQSGWCRFREGGIAREEHVLALVDAWPAPVLQTLREPTVASSMTWMLEFADVETDARADAWHRFDAGTDRAAGGWTNIHGVLWGPSGRLVALSRQTVAVFA
jgi:acyl-CoA thioesterase